MKNEKVQKINPAMFRPFTKSELRNVPVNWNVNGPDFVGVGTGKAGTSWWYSLIMQHPQIEANRLGRKELSYFYHYGYSDIPECDIDTYKQAFAAPPGSLCGEWSPGYLNFPFCIEYLAKAAPKAKILIILRNPVDRTISQLNQLYSVRAKAFNLEPDMEYILKVYSFYPEALCHINYTRSLRQLLRYYDRSQLLILQYEKCQKDPIKEISDTYQFLGIDENFIPADIDKKINKRPYVVPPLNETERKRLAEYFSDDVFEIVNLFPEIELKLWSDF